MVERTGMGDPLRVIPLLWGQRPTTGRRGLSLDKIVEAGITLADELGVEHVSMRKIADRLGVGAMSLYVHVPSKTELIDLMVDKVFHEVQYSRRMTNPVRWREAMEEVADANWALLARHRWLLDVDTTRPPLGPGTIGKYDAELRALVDTGLDDVEMDQALALVLEHVRSSARQAFATETQAAQAREGSHHDWWSQAGPMLASVIDPDQYPYASRVGESAGQTYDAPTDPEVGYIFGLQTILAGLEVLISEKTKAPPVGPPP